MALSPQSLVTFTQHESGTEFPSVVKPLQSEELLTPQHFNWKCTWVKGETFWCKHASYKVWQWSRDKYAIKWQSSCKQLVQRKTLSCHVTPTNRMQQCYVKVLSDWVNSGKGSLHWTYILLHFIHCFFEFRFTSFVVVNHVSETVLDDDWYLDWRHKITVKLNPHLLKKKKPM